MLNVQKFLYAQETTSILALEALTKQFAIKAKIYEKEGIVLLDYDMINSPKAHAITIECRSLILHLDTFSVISRKFDRFFNYGEVQDYYHDFSLDNSVISEKADGSLVGVYYYNGKWNISTRGMAFAEGQHPLGQTFYDKIMLAFGKSDLEFQEYFNSSFLKNQTVIFEYTGPENRIVTRYEKSQMVFLGISQNDCTFKNTKETIEYDVNLFKSSGFNVRAPLTYNCSTMEEILELVNTLPELAEGFVIYDLNSNKRMKVKSSLYILAHSIRGEDTVPTNKNVLKLIFSGEVDEFLCYFPEWTDKIQTLVNKVNSALLNCDTMLAEFNHIQVQKEFAMAISNAEYSGIVFAGRKLKMKPSEVFAAYDINKKLAFFNDLVKE